MLWEDVIEYIDIGGPTMVLLRPRFCPGRSSDGSQRLYPSHF